jgi:hypothetical protein
MPKTLSSLMLLLVLAGAGAVAAIEKDPPREETVEAYDSKTRGAIQVKGETTDWFDVLKDEKALATVPKLLNGSWEVEPGEYEVRVNKVSRKVKVEAGKKVVLLTGTLVVEGKGLYWYPVIGDERKVAGNRINPDLNKPIALFPGTYAADINVNLRKVVRVAEAAKVVAGEKTTVKQ